MVLSFAAAVWAVEPNWWTRPGRIVKDPRQFQYDYAACTVGQLKNMAAQAAAEMDASMQGGAGDDIHLMLANWLAQSNSANDYLLVNAGQMKAVAMLFYDRLAQVGTWSGSYPWTTGSQIDDYAIANVGQLKQLFSFPLDARFDAGLGSGGNLNLTGGSSGGSGSSGGVGQNVGGGAGSGGGSNLDIGSGRTSGDGSNQGNGPPGYQVVITYPANGQVIQ